MFLNFGHSKKIQEIPIVQIRPRKVQIRKSFSNDQLRELALSIRQNGILQPLVVRKLNTEEYELISGERRLRATVLCGGVKVPCIVMDCTDQQAEIYSIVENIQRCDLNLVEEADGISSLVNEYVMTSRETAKELGKRQSFIAGRIKAAKFTDEEKNILTGYRLTEGHALALLKIADLVQRRMVLSEIIENGMNVSQTEGYIAEIQSQKIKDRKTAQKKKLIIKNSKIFENTIMKAINVMCSSGCPAETERNETEEYIEYRVRIPKVKHTKKSDTMTA